MFKELLGEGKDETAVEMVEEGDADNKKGGGRGTGRGGKKGGPRAMGTAKAKEIKGEAGFAEVEDSHSRLISAILTGVNRALPFAKISSADTKYVPFFLPMFSASKCFISSLNKHIDTLFLITHTSTFNISLQALLLIQQISSSLSSSSSLTGSITDRYYRTLYASLHDPRLASSSKQAMYLNLLFKSLRADNETERGKSVCQKICTGTWQRWWRWDRIHCWRTLFTRRGMRHVSKLRFLA